MGKYQKVFLFSPKLQKNEPNHFSHPVKNFRDRDLVHFFENRAKMKIPFETFPSFILNIKCSAAFFFQFIRLFSKQKSVESGSFEIFYIHKILCSKLQ